MPTIPHEPKIHPHPYLLASRAVVQAANRAMLEASLGNEEPADIAERIACIREPVVEALLAGATRAGIADEWWVKPPGFLGITCDTGEDVFVVTERLEINDNSKITETTITQFFITERDPVV